MHVNIVKVFSGREMFTLPPRQSEQYLRMFPDAPTRNGLVVCRIPEEYRVSGQVGGVEISGNVIEHPNGYSWFILVSKKWHYVKAFSGLALTVEEAKRAIQKTLRVYGVFDGGE